MKSIIDNISKEIVSASEGRIAGIVTNVYVDDKLTRVRGYKVSDDESDEAKILPLRRLFSAGEALVVRNLSALRTTLARECPIGAKIYDTCGVDHGVLRDLLYEEGSGIVSSLVADENEFSPERVLSFGKSVVVLRAPAHDNILFRKSATATSRRRETRPLPETVEVIREEILVEEPAETLAEDADFLFQDYAFLLGRRVRKDIVRGEELIAAEEALVTPEVILRAHRSGKLVELTVNSRK